MLFRSIIRDLHTGAEATRLMSLVMLVFSVSPILAPLTGSALIVPLGWRAVFVAVGIAALIALLLVAFLLPETRPAHERISGSVRSVFGSFGELMHDRHFLGLTFIGGLGISSFFAFLSTSSFVYINTAWHSRSTPSASSALRNSRASSAAASAWRGWYWRRCRLMRFSRCCCWR